jgi:hypothetical protein
MENALAQARGTLKTFFLSHFWRVRIDNYHSERFIALRRYQAGNRNFDNCYGSEHGECRRETIKLLGESEGEEEAGSAGGRADGTARL